MREKKEFYVITFATTTAALAMEKSCGDDGIPGRLIPVPREITAGCGLAWRIAVDEYDSYEMKIKDLGIDFEGIVRLWI